MINRGEICGTRCIRHPPPAIRHLISDLRWNIFMRAFHTSLSALRSLPIVDVSAAARDVKTDQYVNVFRHCVTY